MKTMLRTFGLLALLAASAWGDDWTHWGNTNDRARAPAETVVAPAFHGSVVTGSDTVASPIASDGYLVTAGLDGTVRAYAEDTRALVWTAPLGQPVIGTPIIERGRVYIPCTDGTLHVRRLADGRALGAVETGGSDQSSPIVSGPLLYLSSGFPNAALMAIDTGSRTVAWSAEFPEMLHASPVLAPGMVIVASSTGTLASFHPTTGAPIWTTTVGGSPGMSSPVVLGSSVFVLAGATLSRVDLDSANWASNGSMTLTDPSPAPANTASMETAASSLAVIGGRLVGLVRFDYLLDQNGDGYTDAWTLREYSFSIDPATLSVVWQQLIGSTTVPNVGGVPPFKLLPGPVSIGASIAAASSIVSSLKLLAPGTGVESSSFALDAPCQASPFVANGRLYAMTRTGVLSAYEGSAPQPGRATGLTPDGVNMLVSPSDLTWTGAGASYVVRMARDGDILMDWDSETVVGAATMPCPALPDGNHTWGVRVKSASGAWSPWSLASFTKGTPPQPPGPLIATPGLKKVDLSWTASPSASVVGYQLSYGVTSGSLDTVVDLAPGTSTTVSGLVGGTNYTFELRAKDGDGLLSSSVSATATALSTITIGGSQFGSLVAALAAAAPGDIVQIGADTIEIHATLNLPAGVELRGLNALDTRIVATSAVVMIDAHQGSTVSGLSLSGGWVGVQANGSGVSVTNTVIRDMLASGIQSLVATTTAVNNTIVNNSVYGIDGTAAVVARNNILQGNGVGLSGSITSTYNDVSDGYLNCAAGTGDKSVPVLFLNSGTGDYREQANQPSLDAGAPGDAFALEPANNGGRINMGAFGNTSLAATSPTPATGGCGLTGLEVLLLLAFLRRRR